MAEARANVSAVTRMKPSSVNFQMMDEGISIFIPRSYYSPRMVLRAGARSFHRFRNKLVTALFPAPPPLVALVVVAFVAFVVNAPGDSWFRSGIIAEILWSVDSFFMPTFVLTRISNMVRVSYLAVLISLIFMLSVMAIHRVIIRVFLRYRGWMSRGKPSVMTMVWATSLRALIFGGRKPMLYSFQGAMPRLPVPALKDTVTKYLASVRPILDDEAYVAAEQSASDFLKGVGPVLQRYLVLKSFWSTNYVSDWWETYVYLKPRSPIYINSNYYGLGFAWLKVTKVQAARAAHLTYQLLKFNELIYREQLSPTTVSDQVPVPLCMMQYRRMFSTTRIPGRECDKLRHWDSAESKHIVVTCKGYYFRVPVVRRDTLTLVSPADLQAQFLAIVADAKRLPPAGTAGKVAALTTQDRTRWAEIREECLAEGPNHATLDVIESAIFAVHLDDSTPETWTEQGRSLMVGDGTNRWCDKSINLVVFANGEAGLHAEHSFGDAPVVAHAWEAACCEDALRPPYDKDTGYISGTDADTPLSRYVRNPRLLHWNLDTRTEEAILEAEANALKARNDLDLEVFCHDRYGKGFIKTCKIGPDAFIQMALQLAYYRDSGRFVLTYESGQTRLFREGRTETVRSCSIASSAFVKAMESKVSKEKKIELLRAATEEHSNYATNAMCGQGIDRHLFALYVVSIGANKDAPFLKDALAIPWHLSTSQLPQRQHDKWGKDKNNPAFMSPSGGFGPVSDEGYGVSYMICGEDHLFFHVASKVSSDKTSSTRFAENIRKAFKDMQDLF